MSRRTTWMCQSPRFKQNNRILIWTVQHQTQYYGRIQSAILKKSRNQTCLWTPHLRCKYTPTNLKELPKRCRHELRVNSIPHNLVVMSELVDGGCSVHIFCWGFDTDYEGEKYIQRKEGRWFQIIQNEFKWKRREQNNSRRRFNQMRHIKRYYLWGTPLECKQHIKMWK